MHALSRHSRQAAVRPQAPWRIDAPSPLLLRRRRAAAAADAGPSTLTPRQRKLAAKRRLVCASGPS
jgi:hypothetical protein